MYDLHLHSTLSDGDLGPEELVAEAAARGLHGVSLTDHNGLWGIEVAAQVARDNQLAYVAGIEITALHHTADVHILGYSHEFAAPVLNAGLTQTRQGYAARMQEMAARCQAEGFTEVTFANIVAARQQQTDPSYISYDITKQLQHRHGLSSDAARHLTVRGGACYVPYGEWALTPAAGISLLHQANAIAILAHPGTILHERGEKIMDELIIALLANGLDGIEVYHPFHTPELIKKLEKIVAEHDLLSTGGSDWHGPGRFHDIEFGKVGLTEAQFKQVIEALP